MTAYKEIKSGTFYVFVSRYSGIIIQLIISAILARLLSPDEFGVVAAVIVFVNFFQLLGNSGLGSAVVQKQDLSGTEISYLFNISLIFSLLLAVFHLLLGEPISQFFGDDAYLTIVPLLSISLFFYSANSVPLSLLHKNKKFKTVGIIRVVVQFLSGALAIYLAYRGYGYYALVYKNIIMSFLIFILNVKLSGIRVSFSIKFKFLSNIFSFSTFHTLYNTVVYFTRNLDNLLIGKLLGAAALGFYDKAYSLIMMPISNVTRVLNTVLHPVLADFQTEPTKVFEVYKKVAKYLFIIGSSLSIYLFFSAEEIIRILYGDQWISSIPAFRYLSVTIGIQMVFVSAGPIFLSLNKSKHLFFSGTITALTTGAAIISGIYIGQSIAVVALFLILAFSINFFQTYFILVTKVFNRKFIEFLDCLKVGIILTIVLVTTNLLLIPVIQTNNLIFSLLIKSVIAGGIFVLVLILLDEFRSFILLFRSNRGTSKRIPVRKREVKNIGVYNEI